MVEIDWASFYWVGLAFWLLIIIGLILLIIGLWKKSWISLIISGIAFVLPSLYLEGAENWFKLFVVTPLIPFILAFYAKKMVERQIQKCSDESVHLLLWLRFSC